MQHLEVSGAVRPIYGSLGVKRLTVKTSFMVYSLLIPVGVRICYFIKRNFVCEFEKGFEMFPY